ncbi:DUF738-domain-containing protein [Rozella allomycis CSF55]|uniref:Alpha-tubulin N-acetyltransferase domain-containing protein n=1 Tax=Rozella allomycis (strain CSF55) TaxID=988480 RepID=A0A075AR83_ROZAC|nr:Alpha-tubulin N-acetyltransferase domain-containing protein [Rozella allomycis CSF55]RKP21604.1 DUF738-domain-containing protein [Rozella allomycis CSF55]|eukprot:EPZ32665.1 Alpha-tubulin N-acetyltransferase domain-containing protein [Rozella allomycis CSF55]
MNLGTHHQRENTDQRLYIIRDEFPEEVDKDDNYYVHMMNATIKAKANDNDVQPAAEIFKGCMKELQRAEYHQASAVSKLLSQLPGINNNQRSSIVANNVSTEKLSETGPRKNIIHGFLKVGTKVLFISGRQHQIQPLCLLDIYIHENSQRKGFGKKLFDHMLMMLSFLSKHYNLKSYLPQANNFVVFRDYGLSYMNFVLRREPARKMVLTGSKLNSRVAVKNMKVMMMKSVNSESSNQDLRALSPLKNPNYLTGKSEGKSSFSTLLEEDDIKKSSGLLSSQSQSTVRSSVSHLPALSFGSRDILNDKRKTPSTPKEKYGRLTPLLSAKNKRHF